MNTKFDFIFENALRWIKEENEAVDDRTFEDNVRDLAKSLITFLPQRKTEQETIDSAVKQVTAHDKGVKELFLGSQVSKQIKLHLVQMGDSGTFEVEMVGEDVPENAEGKKIKVFTNDQHSENIFEDVAREIKRITLASPEDAIEEMPEEEGANTQPGAQESELPTNSQQAPDESATPSDDSVPQG